VAPVDPFSFFPTLLGSCVSNTESSIYAQQPRARPLATGWNEWK
jgi:hypothetical protein